jgi:hypothetical protein
LRGTTRYENLDRHVLLAAPHYAGRCQLSE